MLIHVDFLWMLIGLKVASSPCSVLATKIEEGHRRGHAQHISEYDRESYGDQP